MALFSYKAKNLTGEEEAGILETDSRHEAVEAIRKKGYFLVSLNEASAKKKLISLSFLNIFSSFFKVSLMEKLFFTKNLEVMIRTGVALPKAFEMLAIQSKSRKFQRTLRVLAGKVIKGESLSTAMTEFPDIFPSLFQETLRVGEETGKLEDSLNILGDQMERENNLKSKIKTAMVYPIVVLVMAFLIGVFMMVFAVPKLKQAFMDLNIGLPITTRIVLGLADFLTTKWPLALAIAAAIFFVFSLLSKMKKGGKLKSWVLLHIPVVAGLVKKTNSALTLRTLSSLLKAGVSVVKTLEVAGGALGNYYFQVSLSQAARLVEKGTKISEALKSSKNLYPQMVLQMMEVGEETGETSEVLGKLADFYEKEVLDATQRLSSIIEPVLILFVGGVVGFFAVAMMQPMFSIMSGIK